ncbi:hypothetical protein CR513_36136, partial [Mucuna pruriens]
IKEECFAIIVKKLPPKVRKLGCFTISYTIDNSYFEKALCDLSANINLINMTCRNPNLQIFLYGLPIEHYLSTRSSEVYFSEATRNIVIDIEQGKLTLRLDNKEVVDIVDEVFLDKLLDPSLIKPLEKNFTMQRLNFLSYGEEEEMSLFPQA